MNILCLLSTFPPDKNGCAIAEESFIKKLSKKEHIDTIAFVREKFDEDGLVNKIKFGWLPIRYVKMFFEALRCVKSCDTIYADIFCSPLAVLLGRLYRKRIVLKNHSILENEECNPLIRYVLMKCMKLADQIITVSEFSLDNLIKNGILKEKICVEHNTVDLKLFRDMKLKRNVILFVGALNLDVKVNGLKVLIDAVEGTNLKLLIIGGGLKLKEAADYARNKAVPAVFLGNIGHDILPKYYSMAKMFVLPSFSENMPLTILEAMACKTPVIATEVGSIPDLIKNDKTGILVKPGDVNALRNAITTLNDNKNIRDKLAANARAAVLEYSDDKSTSFCMVKQK